MATIEAGPPEQQSGRRLARVDTRINGELALVLHSYPYKETSLIVEAFSRRYGRVALVAKGAKRPTSALRSVLLAFRPLSLSWSKPKNSSSDLVTLTRAEWLGGVPGLSGAALVCGFYLNELLMRLLARDDPHETLFDAYLASLVALGHREPASPILRQFEYALLRDIGYALQLTDAHSSAALEPDGWYQYLPERGPIPVDASRPAKSGAFLGKTIYDIAGNDYSDARTLLQSKLLMRQLLAHHLGGQVLHTRQMMIDLNDL
jgi:DNA repair protein RecO (recombination protein O)